MRYPRHTHCGDSSPRGPARPHRGVEQRGRGRDGARQAPAQRADHEDDRQLHWRACIRALFRIQRADGRRRNKFFEQQYLKGAIALELVPQGTLVERLRAHAAGIPAFYTPTGASTAVEAGEIPIRLAPGGGVAQGGHKKEAREFGGRRFVLEPALAGDVALVHAWRADEAGNVVFRRAARNFGAAMAKNAALTIVEAEEIVPVGALEPDGVHLPGVYVDRIVRATHEKQVESMTLAPEKGAGAGAEEAPDGKEAKAREVRNRIARRAAKELEDGNYVNLGVGGWLAHAGVCSC
jgi:3-oxoacid CoA-transferase